MLTLGLPELGLGAADVVEEWSRGESAGFGTPGIDGLEEGAGLAAGLVLLLSTERPRGSGDGGLRASVAGGVGGGGSGVVVVVEGGGEDGGAGGQESGGESGHADGEEQEERSETDGGLGGDGDGGLVCAVAGSAIGSLSGAVAIGAGGGGGLYLLQLTAECPVGGFELPQSLSEGGVLAVIVLDALLQGLHVLFPLPTGLLGAEFVLDLPSDDLETLLFLLVEWELVGDGVAFLEQGSPLLR